MDSMASVLSKINQITTVNPRDGSPRVRVACILDPFSYECFKYECSLEQLSLDNWKRQIDEWKPDFLLVESAWYGLNGQWRWHLSGRSEESGHVMKQLIQHCKEIKLPTVFWNKEDSVEYSRFIRIAKLFDFIFTTDSNCIERYKFDAGHDRIYCLPFAAQPAIHNPIDSSFPDKGKVAFAGTWYKRYAERKNNLRMLLAPAIHFGLVIFDRMHHSEVQFPSEFQPCIIGQLSYPEMVKAYKLFTIFLNVNTVTDSPTMISRRVFEILACGTNIISAYAKGIESMFEGIVLVPHSIEETEKHLDNLIHNTEYSKRLSVLGIREVYSKHLYKHRLDYILEKIGLHQESEETEGVTVVVFQNNKKNLRPILECYNDQVWEKKELILVMDSECVNVAAVKASYRYITIFNQDDYYAPHFLTDLMHALQYSNADLVGKGTYYSYSGHNPRVQHEGRENRFVDCLNAFAMVAAKEVFSHIRLEGNSKEVQRQFFRNCINQGYRIYSSDKYNYVHGTAKKTPLLRQGLKDLVTV